MAYYESQGLFPASTSAQDAETLRNFSLLKMLTPETTESYRGKEIKFPNFGTGIDALGSLMNLLDPSGMLGGPAGFIYKTSATTSPKLLKSLSNMQRIGETAEGLAPRMKAITQDMPVHLLRQLESNPKGIAAYVEPSANRPLGSAMMFQPDPTAVLHEGGGHGLQALDPEVNTLIDKLYRKSPGGTISALVKEGSAPTLLKEEYGARLIEDVLAEQVSNALGIPLAKSSIPFTPEAKTEILKMLQSQPISEPTRTGKEALKKMGLEKTKAPKTSETLKNVYQTITDFSSTNHPLRAHVEDNPFTRVKFYNELKSRTGELPEAHKNMVTKLLSEIKDPKDPSAGLDLEIAAQVIHAGYYQKARDTEKLLEAEFGPEANKIRSKLWRGIFGSDAERDILKLEKREPIGKTAVKEQKDIAKSKEIQDLIKEEIGKYIQKPGRGGTITSKKGGGMISTNTDKLSTYLEDVPRPSEYNELGRKWEF